MVVENSDILLCFKLPVIERDVCVPCFCIRNELPIVVRLS